MRLYYRDVNGKTGMVRDIMELPKELNKLIVKKYDGSDLTLPKCVDLVIDSNNISIYHVVGECETLAIYNSHWNLLLSESFNVKHIKHIDMRNIEDMKIAFSHIRVKTLCPLDYNNVKFTGGMFEHSSIEELPVMVNYNGIIKNIFKDTEIPEHKYKTWEQLMFIKRRT